MSKKRKKNNFTQTFTKVWVNRFLWFSMLCLVCSYVLAFMGRVTIAESLSQTVCTTIIATFVGYFGKSFFETKSEKKLEFEKEKYYIELNNANETVSTDSDEAVG